MRTPTCGTSIRRNATGHACAMRRTLDYAPLVQVGIRNISAGRGRRAPGPRDDDLLRLEHARDPGWMDRVEAALSDTVYITIDLDGLDPGVMPAVGTPEPGGLSWRELTTLLRRTFARKTVVACGRRGVVSDSGNGGAKFHGGAPRLQAADVPLRLRARTRPTALRSAPVRSSPPPHTANPGTRRQPALNATRASWDRPALRYV